MLNPQSAFLACVLVLPASAGAAPPLPLERALELAAEKQPAFDALEAAARSASESAVADGQLPDPRLRIGLQNVPLETLRLNQEPMTQATLGVEQMIPGGAKRALRRQRSKAEAARMSAELAARRSAVRRDTAVAFLAVVGAQRQLEHIGALQRETQRLVDVQQIGAGAGKTGAGDVLAARQMLTMVRDRESEIEMQAAKARAELGRWIGAAAAAPLETDWPRTPPPPPLAELRERLIEHPTHTAQLRAVALAQAELQLAEEAGRPDTSIGLVYGKRASKFGDMVSIQFAMDLPLAPRDRQDRGISAKRALVERAAALREDHLRMLAADLGAVYAEWEFTARRRERIEAELGSDARRRVETALAAYAAGRGELAMVLEARRAELEAQLRQEQLATQLAKVRQQIAYFEYIGEDQ